MKTKFLRLASLLCILALQSCFYSSTVPLSLEKEEVPDELKGSWRLVGTKGKVSANNSDSIVVHLKTGENGSSFLSSRPKDSVKVFIDPLEVKTFTMEGVQLWEIRLEDEEKGEIEYYFAQPFTSDSTIELMFVRDEPFKQNGKVKKYSDSDSLTRAFKHVILQPNVFDSTDIWLFKKLE